jgi:hypothetical protein
MCAPEGAGRLITILQSAAVLVVRMKPHGFAAQIAELSVLPINLPMHHLPVIPGLTGNPGLSPSKKYPDKIMDSHFYGNDKMNS